MRRILDLFCKAGGCSVGYSRAGFECVGCDLEPQKNYPFPFVRSDALALLASGGRFLASNGVWYGLQDFDAVHASPPCQSYSALKHLTTRNHPDLLAPTRDALERTGLPYVIENVPGAPIRASIMLCGTMFGLRTSSGAELHRRRYFETNWFGEVFEFQPECMHGMRPVIMVVGDTPRDPGAEKRKYPQGRNRTICVVGGVPHDPALKRRKTVTITGHSVQTNVKPKNRVISVTGSTPQQNTVHNEIRETFSIAEARLAMDIDWMTGKELAQAIPPPYTHWIGERLIRYLDMEVYERRRGRMD